MIVYKNTFENSKTLNCDFPIEDAYYAEDHFAVVADGITRDPIGIEDLSAFSFKEQIERYPRPSGAAIVAVIICHSFKENISKLLSLKERLILANQQIKEYNQRWIPSCDYLENDYFGAVSAAVQIEDSRLYYSYICDCGVIVYRNGKVLFQTRDDKEEISDPYIRQIGIPWHQKEARIIVRRDFRNNIENRVGGKCISYGALTGEENAHFFIREGSVPLEKDDLVLLYTDGFASFLHEEEFIRLLNPFDEEKFLQYLGRKERESYEKFGKEKTIILMKNT